MQKSGAWVIADLYGDDEEEEDEREEEDKECSSVVSEPETKATAPACHTKAQLIATARPRKRMTMRELERTPQQLRSPTQSQTQETTASTSILCEIQTVLLLLFIALSTAALIGQLMLHRLGKNA